MRTKYLTFRDYAEYFLIFCMFGWLYESFWCCMVERNIGFVNRGVLFGPWLPIYGFGMLGILAILKKYKIENPWKIFFVGTIFSVLVELIGSYIAQACGLWPLWDYSEYFLNFQGRIAFKQGLMFGFLTLAGMCLIYPRIIKLQEKFKNSTVHNICFSAVALLFVADSILRIWLGSNFAGKII